MTMLITRRIFTVAGAAGLVMLAAACGSSSTPGATATSSKPASAASAPTTFTPAAAGSSAAPSVMTVVLKTDTTALGTVLTNAKGFTVYWFAKDTPTSSACAGACAAAWPPVIGMPEAASGVKLGGQLGEIKRPDGTMQATYDGHPLYLYAGDSAPGQANGNGVNGFGALWYAIKIGASTTASTGGSGSTGSSGSGSSGSGSGGSGSGGSGSGGSGGMGSGSGGSGGMGSGSGGSGGSGSGGSGGSGGGW
jgi:predicted lipoprotein with Yx(FWY)xxD motif